MPLSILRGGVFIHLLLASAYPQNQILLVFHLMQSKSMTDRRDQYTLFGYDFSSLVIKMSNSASVGVSRICPQPVLGCGFVSSITACKAQISYCYDSSWLAQCYCVYHRLWFQMSQHLGQLIKDTPLAIEPGPDGRRRKLSWQIEKHNT